MEAAYAVDSAVVVIKSSSGDGDAFTERPT